MAIARTQPVDRLGRVQTIMAHEFDVRTLERILTDTELLVARARDHEEHFGSTIRVLENGPAASSSTDMTSFAEPAFGVRPRSGDGGDSAEVLRRLHDMCVDAREQRLLAERILTRLIGEISESGTRRTVLVVDDSSDSRDLAAEVLEASGFHAITASNGLEALFVAHYARPAVILLDINMPVLNGLEAARLLKASPVTHELGIIAYTATADFNHGPLIKFFVDVLLKPASPDAIASAVRRFVLR